MRCVDKANAHTRTHTLSDKQEAFQHLSGDSPAETTNVITLLGNIATIRAFNIASELFLYIRKQQRVWMARVSRSPTTVVQYCWSGFLISITCRADSSRRSHVVRSTGSTRLGTFLILVDVTITIRFGAFF